MANAIKSHLNSLQASEQMPEELCIATGYFNAAGWLKVAESIEHISKVRLLLGAEPSPATERPYRMPGDPAEESRVAQHVGRVWSAQVHTLIEERDRAFDFSPQIIDRFKKLRNFFRSEHVETRRFPSRFFHAKAWLFRGQDVLAGSSNLTSAGLSTNLELNLGQYDPDTVQQVESWFDDVWDNAEPYDLAAIYEEYFQEWSPYQIFIRVLWELYGEEVVEEAEDVDGRIALTNFQKHGIWRAKKILERYGGVIIADGVGLGKTFTAGGLMDEYQDKRQRILLIRPASLKDTWDNFLQSKLLGNVDSVSYEGLSSEVNAQREGEMKFLRPIEEYQLVVIDEAHNYRNPDSPQRAGILREFLRGQKRDLVLLTATPVNNCLMDLYNLLIYFLRQDSRLMDNGIPSIKGVFDRARREEPEDLHPDILYPVIDATTVKRTRLFINKHYRDDLIPLPDGSSVRITFPKPIPKTIRYAIESVIPDFITKIEDALLPQSGPPKLKLARYQPEMYLKVDPDNQSNELFLIGLLRSSLLKRFESSVFAFRNTCTKMAAQCESFLEALEQGKVLQREFYIEHSASSDIDIDELLEETDHYEDADLYDIAQLQADATNDLMIFREFINEVDVVTKENDPKLKSLAEELAFIAEEASKEGIGEEDTRTKQKVIIYSFFKDTAEWIHDYLQDLVQVDPRLSSYKDRIVATSGTQSTTFIKQADAASGFAPKTAGKEGANQEDKYDILITTDVLAEGVNLQQARHIINYDLPWNPMRLVQRHGRIDRLLSEHKKVFVRTFFPDHGVDRLLRLEERVRNKLYLASASIGLEDDPIEKSIQRNIVFSETRQEIEKIINEDSSLLERGGNVSAAQTGEEYRARLRKEIEGPNGNTVVGLPWKIGSGMIQGDLPGHFFCARIGKDKTYLRFVPIDAVEAEDVIKEPGTCLRMIDCDPDTPRVLPQSSVQRAYEAWGLARKSIWTDWDFMTDPKNLQPRVPRVNLEVEQYLLEKPPKHTSGEKLRMVSDVLLSPWSHREQNKLRAIWTSEYSNDEDKSMALYNAVVETGIEPFELPNPFPHIDEEEISLICWLAIEKELSE